MPRQMSCSFCRKPRRALAHAIQSASAAPDRTRGENLATKPMAPPKRAQRPRRIGSFYPYLATKPVFWRGLSTFSLGFGGAKYPRASTVLVHLRDSGLV